MERARAARAMIDCYGTNSARREASLEAFMSIFHPEKANDRKFMTELKEE
jgi:hypothetical protein